MTQFQFLIIGAGRGGTSLLAGLLDHHSQLEVGIELYTHEYLLGKRLADTDAKQFRARGVAFVEACEQEAIKHAGKIWGNKITTEQLYWLESHNEAYPVDRVDVFDAFFNVLLRDRKIIFILRDGRTCVRSKMRRNAVPFDAACERWLYSVAVHRFLRDHHKNNLRIKYETLVTRTIPTLTHICDFLGVPFEEQMLGGTANSKLLPEYRRPKIDDSSLTLTDIPVGCEERLATALQECGYDFVDFSNTTTS